MFRVHALIGTVRLIAAQGNPDYFSPQQWNLERLLVLCRWPRFEAGRDMNKA